MLGEKQGSEFKSRLTGYLGHCLTFISKIGKYIACSGPESKFIEIECSVCKVQNFGEIRLRCGDMLFQKT